MFTASSLLITARPHLVEMLGELLEPLNYEPPLIVAGLAEARESLGVMNFDLLLFDSVAAAQGELEAATALGQEYGLPLLLLTDLPSAARAPDAPRLAIATILSPLSIARALGRDAECSCASAPVQAHHSVPPELVLTVGEILHDLSNLLARAIGYAELALTQLHVGSDTHDLVGLSLAGAVHARAISAQITHHLERRHQATVALDLNQLLYETGELLRRSLGPRGRLQYRLASDVPSIKGSPTELRQVLVNLVCNAAEAFDDEDGVITLTTFATTLSTTELAACQVVQRARAGEYMCVEVRDTGRGMDAAIVERMFDPFFTTRARGTGLGLASAERIVIAHEGAIAVHSAPGLGTVVRVYLPVAAPFVPGSARNGR